MSKIADAAVVVAIQHTPTVASGAADRIDDRASNRQRLSFYQISRAVSAEQLGTMKEKRLKGAPHRLRLPTVSSSGGRVIGAMGRP
jgi:hypothetical protein